MRYTYQDYLEVLGTGSEEQLMQFVLNVINNHKNSEEYKTAVLADEYFRHKNRTIIEFQKLLYTVTGKAVPDNYSANYKLSSNFLYQFITQLNQYLLSNGVSWNNDKTADALGEEFDTQLQKAGEEALKCGVSFGFMNFDHLDVFNLREFAPLYDEENGSLCAGVRFWQINTSKPLRATLYDWDGYAGYIWRNGEGSVYAPKQPYKVTVKATAFDGAEIFEGENYPEFPIVPFYGINKQSELVGRRELIDCYDLIKSGFANLVDENSLVYWTIENAGGMKDMDLAKFVERIKTVKAAAVGDGQRAEAHSMELPYNSREALLDRLRDDLYEDFMALDTKNIAGGAATATQIKAAYEPLDLKTNDYEYCVRDFLKGVLAVLGIEDDYTFTRSKIVDQATQMSMLIQLSQYLDEEYITRKGLEILGDGDKADDVLKRKDAEDMQRINLTISEEPEENEEIGNQELKDNLEGNNI